MIIPGYIAGLGCLLLITYITIIAYVSDSKSLTIFINKFGEQFYDLIALIIIWAICLMGFIILIRYLKEEKKKIFFLTELIED